jgi:bifunctional non-homologous end joining protein LigD
VGGFARLDCAANAMKDFCCSYSPRPAVGATASAPISWDELDDPHLRPDGFTIASMSDRLAGRADLFAEVLDTPQRLPALR